jgi:hypothetical protein
MRARALVQRVLCHTRGLYSRWLQSQEALTWYCSVSGVLGL